jgi:hypothetical protein
LVTPVAKCVADLMLPTPGLGTQITLVMRYGQVDSTLQHCHPPSPTTTWEGTEHIPKSFETSCKSRKCIRCCLNKKHFNTVMVLAHVCKGFENQRHVLIHTTSILTVYLKWYRRTKSDDTANFASVITNGSKALPKECLSKRKMREPCY